MSRFIDRLPPPKEIKEKKIIALTRSRSGTHSFYCAMKKLGYTPYHMFEVLDCSDDTHIRLFTEALRCKYFKEGKPYGKAEFDKWWAAYDAIIEIPPFFVEEVIEFYPNAKFVLVDRDHDTWERSARSTIAKAFVVAQSFPFNILRWVDPWFEAFVALGTTWEAVAFHGRGFEGGLECAKRDTDRVRETALKLIPKDQLLHHRLEDGFGWEQICPFLGIDIPKEPYNNGNNPEDFARKNAEVAGLRIRNAMLRLLMMAAGPLAGVGVYVAANRQWVQLW